MVHWKQLSTKSNLCLHLGHSGAVVLKCFVTRHTIYENKYFQGTPLHIIIAM